jgi:hypothetical protein
VRPLGLLLVAAAIACSKDPPRPAEPPAEVPTASAAPVASASAVGDAPSGTASTGDAPPSAGSSTSAAGSASAPGRAASVPGSSTRLLDPGLTPRRALHYTWHVEQKEQLSMDLRTSASTEVAGAKQPEIPLPPVHIVLDIDPQNVTAGGDLRYAWRVTSASVTADPLTPSSITEGMRVEVNAIDHLAGSAVVTARGLCSEVTVERAAAVDGGATGQMVEQIRQTLRDVAVPLPEEEIGRGARWQKTSQLDAKGSRLTQTDTFTLTEATSGDTGTVDDVLAQTAPPQLLRTPGASNGGEARMDSMLASGESKTRFDLSRLVPQSKFTGTTTMVVSGASNAAATKRATMVMRVGIDIQGQPR